MPSRNRAGRDRKDLPNIMRMPPILTSITVRLTVLVLLISSCFYLFLVLVFGGRMKSDIEALSAAQLLVIANYAAQDIDRDIIRRREFLADLARRAPRAGQPAEWRRWTADILDSGQLFPLGIFVLDPRGEVLAKSPGAAERHGGGIAAPDTLARAISDGFTLERARIGVPSRTAELAMAMPVTAGAAGPVLVGITPLRGAAFLDALSRTKVGRSGGLALVSPADRMFLAASDMDIELRPTPPEHRHPQHDRAMQGFRGVGIDTRIDGVEELAAIASVPSSGWFVVARIPTQEIFEPADNVRAFTIETAIISGVILSLVLLAAAHHLLRHLRHAAAHADRMTLGQMPFESLPVARNDEVGHLTAAFNRLLAALLASRAEMERLALSDSLTGLANRKQFNDTLERTMAKARRHGTPFAVFYIDLNGFKPINDTFGHGAGDEVLRQVARRLTRVMRREDLLARIGGDEFALLVGTLKGAGHDLAAELSLIAGKCEAALADPIPYQGHDLRVGLSIGAACYPDDGDTAEALLARADQAMYRVKHGRA